MHLTDAQFRRLRDFCRTYGAGYILHASTSPHEAPRAVGMRGATLMAQLCEGNVVEVAPSIHCLHGLAHEIGHAQVEFVHGPEKFHDERLVAVEQIAFLVNLGKALLCGQAKAQGEIGRVA